MGLREVQPFHILRERAVRLEETAAGEAATHKELRSMKGERALKKTNMYRVVIGAKEEYSKGQSWDTIFRWVVREGLSEEGTFEQDLRCAGANLWITGGQAL